MGDIIPFHKIGQSSVLNEIVSLVYDDFSAKWDMPTSKPLWVRFWSDVILDADVTFDAVLLGSHFCVQQLSDAPDVFYFIHLCVLSDEFRHFFSNR